MEELIFANWKPRASSFGTLLTSLPKNFTTEDKEELEALLLEKRIGVNANGNKTKFTDTKQSAVEKLQEKQLGSDILPTGAITKLEEIFDAVFWQRKKLLNNKYLMKGIMNEEDSIDLLSKVEGITYWKNDEFISNEYCQGTPDIITDKLIIDIKSNYELSTFRKAELTDLYEWQIKSYLWIKGMRNGQLCYSLVNSPLNLIENEKKSLYFAMGMPEEDEERWVDAVMQLEKNHIFDLSLFKRDYPSFDLMNKVWSFNIPPHLRIKTFDVTLLDEDILHMVRRSKMCKAWLIEREKLELKLINNK